MYVNTAASGLDLKNGAVANSLRAAGGPKLQEECTQYTQANGDVQAWQFATTRGHKLKWKPSFIQSATAIVGKEERAVKVRVPKLLIILM